MGCGIGRDYCTMDKKTEKDREKCLFQLLSPFYRTYTQVKNHPILRKRGDHNMDEQKMKELNLDEMDRVSGGRGENPRDNTSTCPYCGYEGKKLLQRSDRWKEYQCNNCQCEWIVEQ